jgi:hypothetical protein
MPWPYRCTGTGCNGTLEDGVGLLHMAGGYAAVLFNAWKHKAKNLTGQGSKFFLKCGKCRATYTVCPFCDSPVEAGTHQVGAEMTCTSCGKAFVMNG